MGSETVIIKEINGPANAPVFTSLANIVGRYCTADIYNPGTLYPNKVPTTDFNYSYAKSMVMVVSGSFNSIRDIQWYCDGSVATDWGLKPLAGGGLLLASKGTGDFGCPYAQYFQSTGDVGVTGDWIGHASNGDPFYNGEDYPTTNADLYTAASPAMIDSTVYVSGFTSKIWKTQLKVPPTADHGELSSKTFTLAYQVY